MASKKKPQGPVYDVIDEPERFVPQTQRNKDLPEDQRAAYDLMPYTHQELHRAMRRAQTIRDDHDKEHDEPMPEEEYEGILEQELFAIQVRGIHNVNMRGADGAVVAVEDPRVIWRARSPELVVHVGMIRRRLLELGQTDPNS